MASTKTRLFNESSFALAISFELLDWIKSAGDLVAAPIIPSLQDEADQGWDLHLPTQWALLYLQFKVSQRMVGANATEASAVPPPYYRFKAKTNATSNGNVQHNLLVDLAAGQDSLVYYVAPLFHEVPDLYRHLQRGTTLRNAVFARPEQLGRVAAGSRHSYTFTGHHDIQAHSTPSEFAFGSQETLFADVREAVHAQPKIPAAEFIVRKGHQLSERHKWKMKRPNEPFEAGPDPRLHASRLEREIFGYPLPPEPYLEASEPRAAKKDGLTPFQAIEEAGAEANAIPFLIGSR